MEINEQTRICWKCKTPKKLTSEFFYKEWDGFQKACKECQKKRNAKYKDENPEYFKQKGKENYKPEENKARYQKTKVNFLKRKEEWYLSISGRLYDLMQAAKDRSKKKNTPFDLTLDFLLQKYEEQNGTCVLTGLQFIFERTSNKQQRYTPFGPSLDKIDYTKGYTQDNTRLVCVIVNLALNTFGDECFDKMCEAYIKKKNNL